jgi:hypothetical protein
VIDVGQGLSNLPSNFALAPVTASRGVVKVGQTLTFRSAVHLSGFEQFARPKTLTVLVNGKRHEDLSLPRNSDLKEGQIPLQWQMKYDKPGPHVVSLFLDADSGSDALVADNQQHIVIDAVAELPVLLIDGELKPVGESSAFFVQQALSAKRVVSYADLKPATIIKEKPAVVVLADAPRLEPSVIEAMDRFLSDGGGLLIAVGERVAREKAYYNDKLHRQGQGWLPARLLDVASSKDGERPEPRGFQHAALDVFRAAPGGVMSQVRFEKWWKSQVDPKARATAIAWLSGGDPFLFEMPYKKGRVILCTTPLDRSWGSTLPNGAEFPVLVNELVFYLAGASQGATTLRNGEPIRLPDPGGSIKKLTVDTPMERKERDVKSWPWTFADTGAIGVYRVQAEDRRWSYLVPPDLRESDLTRCSDADWRQVRERLPAAWQEGAAPTPTTESSESQRKELWWLFLIGVIGLLCCELWLTRRMAMARGH